FNLQELLFGACRFLNVTSNEATRQGTMSTKIGHFEILSELSKSATCTVYKATDSQTSQTVALKAIQLSAFGDYAAELEKCLLAEAETTKALSHANLAPVHGAGN